MSFWSLITEGDLLRNAFSSGNQNSKLDFINGQLAEVEKQASKILGLIEGEAVPPKLLLKKLQQLEEREQSLQAEAEAEKVRIAIPAENAFKQLNDEITGLLSGSTRSSVRNNLRDLVERIDLDIGNQTYTVRLKGYDHEIQVVMTSEGYSICPAPLWVTKPALFQGKEAAGKFTNVLH
jgi:hypothetical protein